MIRMACGGGSDSSNPSAPGSSGNPPQSWQAAVGTGTIITALESF
jgi:hypothetical protein